jgi:hypothetical protein
MTDDLCIRYVGVTSLRWAMALRDRACGVAATPIETLAASAQEPGRTYRIGGLINFPRTGLHWVAFPEELRRAGFLEGQNLLLTGRGWPSPPEQFPEIAVELVKAKVDVITCTGYGASTRRHLGRRMASPLARCGRCGAGRAGSGWTVGILDFVVPPVAMTGRARRSANRGRIDTAYAKALTSGRRDGTGGLSARTVTHMHRVLREALQQGVRWQLLVRNPADAATPPKAERKADVGAGFGRCGLPDRGGRWHVAIASFTAALRCGARDC